MFFSLRMLVLFSLQWLALLSSEDHFKGQSLCPSSNNIFNFTISELILKWHLWLKLQVLIICICSTFCMVYLLTTFVPGSWVLRYILQYFPAKLSLLRIFSPLSNSVSIVKSMLILHIFVLESHMIFNYLRLTVCILVQSVDKLCTNHAF